MVAASGSFEIPKMPSPDNRAFWERFERNARLGIAREKVEMRRQMRETAAYERMQQRKTVDGLGQLVASVPSRLYFRWLQEDAGFWNDGKNIDRFIRDNPELKAAAPERKYY